ncbi:hypothetical protein WCE34_00235 [Luteimonas sp. MJ204]|uniref:hypothetical protein n=1 Tax=Luteimonas sp. MJ145 TaxID=3129234 RepID=UPI0031BAF672
MSMRHSSKALLMTFGAVLALSACGGGADRVASPGEGAFPPPPTTPPPPPPTTPPPPPPPPTSGPAENCPDGFRNIGTIADFRACELPERIIGELTVPKAAGTVYAINGAVHVGEDMGGDPAAPRAGAREGILNIEPGVTVYASAGPDALVVNRGSKIYALGTAEEPIILTAKIDVEGNADAETDGRWGGLVLAGRSPVNTCIGDFQPGSAACETRIEGGDLGMYGGNSTTDNSGTVQYMQIKYSGFAFSGGNELQGLTMGGVGSGTTIEYVQVHNSSDDGIEIFGGSVNARRIVVTGASDDSLDIDSGWNGGVQFGVVVQRDSTGDNMNEWSGTNSSNPIPLTPEQYSNPQVANFTYVGRAGGSSGNGSGFTVNLGSRAEIYNTVVTRKAGGTGKGLTCLSIEQVPERGSTAVLESVFFACPDNFNNADAEAAFTAGTNTVAGNSTLTGVFVNGANESAVPAVANLASKHSFFEQVDYIGGVKDSNDTWWQGWTCGLTADASC